MTENTQISGIEYDFERATDRKNTLVENIIIIYICFCLFFPSTYNSIKFLFAFIILGLSFFNMMRRYGKITKDNLLWMLILIGANLISICVGVCYNAPGALATITIDIIWPIFYLVCISQIKNELFWDKFYDAMVSIAIIICLYDIGFVLKTFYFTWIPDFLYSLQLTYSIGRSGAIIEYSIDHFYSIYFLTLATFGLLFSFRNIEDKMMNRKAYVALFLELLCMVLMGKTTALILLIVMPIAYKIMDNFIEHIFLKRNPNILFFIILLIILLFLVIMIEYLVNIGIKEVLSENYAKVLRLINNPNDERNKQFRVLISGWMQHPLLGNGTGSYSAEYVRSIDTPWAYELTYILLLFQKGLFGFIVFFAYVIWLYLKIIYKIQNREIQKGYGVAYMLGMLGILISNGMNPTLGKAGLIWIIYLPLAFFNNCDTFGEVYE